MPEASLERLALSTTAPLLPTSFHVGAAAQATIANAALAASEISGHRHGKSPGVSVDMHDAEIECTGYFRLNGEVPNAWAPLSGLYACGDGYVRIHANFDHHRDRALDILGITHDPSKTTKDDIGNALSSWSAVDFESAVADAGGVVSAVRSFDEWDAHPHARVVSGLPLLTIEKIGEAPPRETGKGDKPLSNIRVLDLTRILAGPVCGRTLAAYGADVMLVNSPSLPNIESIAETSRGKRSVHIDLSEAVGADQLEQLVSEAHIFIQGYRPGGLPALGFSPERLAELRPGIVYVSLSAYSHEGPWSDRRGFDSLVQTATGFNHAEAAASGEDWPRAMPVQILDYASGFLMAYAAQAALYRQMTEGGSWHARISLIQTAQWLRGLGRTDNLSKARPDIASRLQSYECGFGTLEALPHAAKFDGEETTWNQRSEPPGTHPPQWV
jgi:crotonobetainyl-CoA:carnitine CoA-transferase CaiB-like acyl-CoA transferase